MNILKTAIAWLFIVNCSLIFASDHLDYVINISDPGNYYLWVRAKASKHETSLINIQINSGSVTQLMFTDKTNLQWKRVDSSYNLDYGSHKLTLQTSALGMVIDKILWTTNSGYQPSGVDISAVNPASKPHVSKVIDLGGKGWMPIMGDVNNDGKIDFVVTGLNYVSVFDNSGVLLWQNEISGNKLQYVIDDGAACARPIDIDADGVVELVGIFCFGNAPYLAAIDATTGVVKSQLALPILTDNWQYDTLQIANFRGLATPQDVVIKYAKGGYVPFKVVAYKFENGQFQQLWQIESAPNENRAGSHRPKVFDIDQDGRDEVINGFWLYNHDGTIKWEKPYGFFDQNHHIDSQRAGDIIPNNPGIEIAYASGTVVLDSSGNVLWRKDIDEGQSVALAEMRADLPGLEVLVHYQEPYNNEGLFSSSGELLWMFDGQPHYAASYETYPIQWIGDQGRESVRQEWGRDRSPAIYDEFNNLVVRLTPEYDYGEGGYRPCDVTGDYREELVYFNENYIVIYENIAPNTRSFPSPWLDPIYRENQYNWVYY